jgi:hypothetical protein
MTRGKLMQSHAMVTLDAVCDQFDEVREIREVGDVGGFTELGTVRLVNEKEGAEVAVGEPGAGDAVEFRKPLREEPLVGDNSSGGNSRVWRVETMIAR